MKNFSDYISSKNDSVDRNKKCNEYNNFDENNNEKTNNSSVNSDTKKLEELMEKYASYSKDDLMNEFIKMTIQRKKEGTISNTELNNLKEAIIPYLNDEQKENLEKLLEIVKNV